jgi:ribosomal protein S18 acetylase RimI-like enzyme
MFMEDAVRTATGADLARVAELHEAAFPGFFLTRMGRPFLRAYYRLVLEYGRGILLVAEGPDGVVGFVAGFLEPDGFYRLMRSRKWRMLAPIALGVLQRPSTLGAVLANIRKVRAGGPAPADAGGVGCELSSLGVHPSASGRGVGQALVRGFVSCSAAEGADRVFLTTDADGNERVNGFYRKLGFSLSATLEGHAGRKLNVYVLEV